MKNKKANKKGLNYYSPLIAIMGIFILGAILSNLFVRQYNLASEFDLGREQFRILLAQSYAEKALLFVDDAAKLALEKAAYSYGKNGFYQSASSCGNSNGFNLWTKEQSLTRNDCVPQPMACNPNGGDNYPNRKTMESTLVNFFTLEFGGFVKGFNEKNGLKAEDGKISIPFSYDFKLSPVVGRTEVVGISKEPVAITATKFNPLKYEVKPSFRESITPDVIAGGNDVTSKAPQLLRKKEADVRSSLGSFNSQNPDLKWSLASYSTPSSSCSHVIRTCTYTCNCQDVCGPCGKDGKEECCSTACETCVGRDVETVSYRDVYAAFSVANGKSFYVSDPPASQPQLKAIAYNFGLNWLEETGRGTKCVP